MFKIFGYSSTPKSLTHNLVLGLSSKYINTVGCSYVHLLVSCENLSVLFHRICFYADILVNVMCKDMLTVTRKCQLSSFSSFDYYQKRKLQFPTEQKLCLVMKLSVNICSTIIVKYNHNWLLWKTVLHSLLSLCVIVMFVGVTSLCLKKKKKREMYLVQCLALVCTNSHNHQQLYSQYFQTWFCGCEKLNLRKHTCEMSSI